MNRMMFQVVMGGPNSLTVMKDLKGILDGIEVPVIVEGDSDRFTLRRLGVENIIPLNGKPLFKIASKISRESREAVVLTDFDSEGRKIAKKLNDLLTSFGVTPDERTRKEVERRITKVGVSTIENINTE